MKIGQLDTKGVTPAVSERRTSGNAPTAAAPQAAAGTQVKLSSTAADLKTGNSEAVVDAAKVKRISDAIRDGKFEVNPNAIADKLISNARELLGSGGK